MASITGDKEDTPRIEKAAAVAVIYVKGKKEIKRRTSATGKRSPKQAELSEKTRLFLLQDALTNLVLQSRGK